MVGELTMVLLTVVVSREVAGDCGGTYLAPNGIIRIPSHQDEYSSSKSCVYVIKVHRITCFISHMLNRRKGTLFIPECDHSPY